MFVKSIFCIVFLFIFAVYRPAKCVSSDQLEKMAKSMRKSCLQKIDTTDDAVDGLRRGEFPNDENLACYTNCIMKTLRSFKNGAIDFDMINKQVDMTMPAESASRVKENIAKCSKNEYSGDPCSITYDYVKCFYEVDPETFFFP